MCIDQVIGASRKEPDPHHQPTSNVETSENRKCNVKDASAGHGIHISGLLNYNKIGNAQAKLPPIPPNPEKKTALIYINNLIRRKPNYSEKTKKRQNNQNIYEGDFI